MTTLAADLQALCARVMRLEPILPSELHALSVRAARLEYEANRLRRTLDEMAEDARQDARCAERAANVVPLRPKVRVVTP
jgi:hypothetical protein